MCLECFCELLKMQYVTLNNWVQMPILWFWVYKVYQDQAKEIVLKAINTWYRLIDTAQYYENERWVWQAIKASWISRKEFFVTTKLITKWYENTLKGIDISLQKLWYDYFDLVLIHWPKWDNTSIYKALETAYKQWKTRAIGLSNFNEELFLDIYNNCEIKPAINQIETHIMWQQWRMHEFLNEYNCIHESWSPLWAWKFNLYENNVLKNIAEKYNKTIAQIMLRFFIQNNVVIIPKTAHIERMKENFELFDFQLSEEDISEIKKLDQRTSYTNRPESMLIEQRY